MTYLPSTIGADWMPGESLLIDPSNFNDTRFPGTVYATNGTTHVEFVNLQNQLNRGAAAKGLSTRIATDGKIGSDTVKLAGQVSLNTAATTSASTLARYAKIVAAAAKAKADAANIPSKPPAPKPASPPAIYNAKTDSLTPPPVAASIAASLQAAPMAAKLGLGALVLGAGYYLATRKKK